MYSKEEIVAEMQRVAKFLKVETYTAEQFQECSTIPISTVEFFLGSWKSALQLADLQGVVRKEPTSKDLLSELWRIYNETGEVPSNALIDKLGIYASSYYQQQWRSLDVAFQLAQRYYGAGKEGGRVEEEGTDSGRTHFFAGDEITLPAVDGLRKAKKDTNEDSQEFDVHLAATVVSAPIPHIPTPPPAFVQEPKISVDVQSHKPTDLLAELRLEPQKSVDNAQELEATLVSWGNDDSEGAQLPDFHVDLLDPQRPVIIPEVSLQTPDNQRLKGERFYFRGLNFPPRDHLGVIFLFGMVANELGFFLETAGEMGNGFSGWRTLSLDETEWSAVRVVFAQQSSDLIEKITDFTGVTHVICWNHDWSGCPVSVLVLSSVIQDLPNYKRPS